MDYGHLALGLLIAFSGGIVLLSFWEILKNPKTKTKAHAWLYGGIALFFVFSYFYKS